MQAKDGSEILGLDISQYQGITDENLLFTSMPNYFYHRAYGSDHTSGGDTRFIERIALAKSYGVPSGAYYFGTPLLDANIQTDAEIIAHAQTQANQFIGILEQAFGVGNMGDIIPMLDIESYTDSFNNHGHVATGTSDYPKASGMTGDQLITWIKAFRDHFWNQSQRRVGFYSNRYFLEDATQMAMTTAQLSEISDMPLWLAEYDQWYGGETGNVQPLDLGGWTMWWLWQYTQQGTASDYGLSHSTNHVDINRTKDMSWLLVPPKSNDFTLTDGGNGSLRVDYTHPVVEDYIGSSIYVDGVWKAWIDEVATYVIIEGLPMDTALNVQVATEDNGHDITFSDAKTITLTTPTTIETGNPVTVEGSPVVTIISTDLTKLSDEAMFSSSDITFQFDIPVVAYSVRSNGTSHDSGMDVGTKDKFISTTASMTILESSAMTVKEFRSFVEVTPITETIDYTELYSEGTNRVNIYGMAEDGTWTPYNQA